MDEEAYIPQPQDTNSSIGRSETVSERVNRLRKKNIPSSIESYSQPLENKNQFNQQIQFLKIHNDFDPDEIREVKFHGRF